MPLMWKESIQDGTVNYPGMHFLTEDPRPGHNVMYFGRGLNAFDSVSLKPLWGLAGTFRQDIGSSYYGGANQYIQTNTNHEYNKKVYMMLAGAHPMGYGRAEFTTSVGNGVYYNNVHASSFQNMDTEQKPSHHYIKDNGDGTHDLIIHSADQSMGHSQEYYAEQHHYTSIPDDMELYEVGPNYVYITTTTAQMRGTGASYSALDGTNSGFVQISNQISGYPTHASISMHRMGSGPILEKSGGSTGTTNGYYSQFAGMSRLDGMPIFFEFRHSWYTPFHRITKYSGSSYTTLLSQYTSSNGYPPWRYVTTSYSYASVSANTEQNAGTSDSQVRLSSCWFRHADQPANMYYTVTPWSYLGVPYGDIFRWDRATDTFVGAGVNGVSTEYASLYHRVAGANGWTSAFNNYMATPYEARREKSLNTATSSGHSGVEQGMAYAIACDAHGFANADGSTESAFQTEDYPGGGNVQPISFMNMSPVDGAFDSNAKGRAIMVATVYSNTGVYSNQTHARGVTWVPETPIDWVWCDSGKTTIAAICKNATYIYQCRKGANVTDGSSMATGYDMNPDDSTDGFNTGIFNNTVNPYSMGWIHTATIPYNVLQMGIDKHDRLWYITYSHAGPYVGATNNYNIDYHKQMWMLTTATPHKVNLTGNATTDTISYTGTDIDKTLTIEALNFKGQRLAKTITLNITSTNAEFDNGSQTKDVTTSASGTVNETITVTGAGSFNITAAYGA